MSDETKDRTVDVDTPQSDVNTPQSDLDTTQAGVENPQAAAETAAVQVETPKSNLLIEPIRLELEDLTAEGKEKTEKALGRKIEDIPYTLVIQENRPESLVALQIEVSHEAHAAEQARLLNDLRKEAVLPGFRKGKVPLKLLQIRLGEDAIRDTIRSLAANVLRQENAKQNFKILVKPEVIQYQLPEEAGGPLKFDIELEVEPNVEIKQYQGLKVEVIRHPVTEEQVNGRLETLRRQNSILEEAGEDAMVNPGDVIVADITVYNEAGDLIEAASKVRQEIGNFQEELPKELAEQLPGKKIGETIKASIAHQATNRRGETVTHHDEHELTIREIKIEKLPALDDEFAKDLGDYATLADLRAKIRKDLEDFAKNQQREQALQGLYRQLVTLNPVDAPRTLLTRQAYNMIMEDQRQFAQLGLRLDQLVTDTDQYFTERRLGAEVRLKVQLLLDKISELENLVVTDEDVDREIEAIAEKTGRKPLAVRAKLEAGKQLKSFRHSLGMRKLGDFLLAHNTVEETDAPEKPIETDVLEPPIEAVQPEVSGESSAE